MKGTKKIMDYKKAYHKLFNVLTDTIEQLQQAQRDTEDMYIEGADSPEIRIVPRDTEPKDEK